MVESARADAEELLQGGSWTISRPRPRSSSTYSDILVAPLHDLGEVPLSSSVNSHRARVVGRSVNLARITGQSFALDPLVSPSTPLPTTTTTPSGLRRMSSPR